MNIGKITTLGTFIWNVVLVNIGVGSWRVMRNNGYILKFGVCSVGIIYDANCFVYQKTNDIK